LVARACDVDSWFLAFPRSDSAFEQLYWSNFSLNELRERFQGISATWQILARLSLLFPRTMATVTERQPRYDVLTSRLRASANVEKLKDSPPREALTWFFETASSLCETLELRSAELSFTGEILRYEYNLALACLEDDGKIPVLQEGGTERIEVFGFDVAALLGGTSLDEVRRGGRCEVAFSISGPRVVANSHVE